MFVIDTEKLELGRALRFDLTTPDGRMLAKAGTTITVDHISEWLGNGIKRVCSYQEADFVDQPVHLRPYNPKIVQRLEDTIEKASELVLEQTERILRCEPVGTQQLQGMVHEMLANIDLDMAAAIAVSLGTEAVERTDVDRAIAARCSQLSLLSMAISTELDYSQDDRQTLGIAALLHDISLMPMIKDIVAEISGSLPFKNEFLDHPLASASLLESVLGLNKKICLAVSQVHEQPNGGGFPKGLQSHRIMPMARLLGMLDAYLTLTSAEQPAPFPSGCNLQPSDAVAYLMHNARRGRFDPDAVKGLVRSVSFYPIGSRVQLSDQSYAVVLRSKQEEPGKPVVRIDNSSFSIVDLGMTSLRIIQPVDEGHPSKQRILRSSLDEVLYR